MSSTTLGDLSQSYSLRQRNVALRQQIGRLTEELASGQVADTRDVLSGNYSYLTDTQRRLDILNGYSVATTEAGLYAGDVQTALGVIEETGLQLSGSLLAAGTSAIGASGADTAAEARHALEAIVGASNTSSGGRYVLSGTATDRPPLPDAQMLLDALRSAVSGAATPDDLLTSAGAWFDDPAGFEATVYQGADTALAPFALSQTDSVALDVRVSDPKLREVLKLTAVAALADDPAFGFSVQDQSALFDRTGQALLTAQDNVIALRAGVGFAQARVDQISVRNAAERTSLEIAKTALLEVDPFEAATRLEEAQFQLQSLYSVTVRMSQLSLVNFL